MGFNAVQITPKVNFYGPWHVVMKHYKIPAFSYNEENFFSSQWYDFEHCAGNSSLIN